MLVGLRISCQARTAASEAREMSARQGAEAAAQRDAQHDQLGKWLKELTKTTDSVGEIIRRTKEPIPGRGRSLSVPMPQTVSHAEQGMITPPKGASLTLRDKVNVLVSIGRKKIAQYVPTEQKALLIKEALTEGNLDKQKTKALNFLNLAGSSDPADVAVYVQGLLDTHGSPKERGPEWLQLFDLVRMEEQSDSPGSSSPGRVGDAIKASGSRAEGRSQRSRPGVDPQDLSARLQAAAS